MKGTMSVSHFLAKVSNIAQTIGQSHVFMSTNMDKSTGMGNKVNPNSDRKKMLLTATEQMKLKNDPTT
jgi:hypothetical protein